jgi:hypothetical protein
MRFDNLGDSHHRPRLRTILITAALSAVYLASLWLNFTEAERRSVTLEIPPAGADYLQMDVNVVHVDLLRSEMTTRISFRLAGRLAQDELTPATDLQLVLNTVNGQQQFDFAKGQRLNPIEAVFPLQGEVNFYPFDHHKGVLWLSVTLPGRQQSKPNPEPAANIVPEEVANSPSLPVSTASLEKRVQADTRTTFTATIPGLTFRGSQSVQSAQTLKGLTGIDVNLMRSSSVVFISVTTMVMMAAMAVGLVIMVLKIVGGSRNVATFHIPMAVSLIFGLPALRNIQPGIPPQGTFGDSIAFTWAEIAAAGSAIALITHWLLHRTHDNPPTAKKS